MSLADLADELDVDRSTVSKWESGDREVGDEMKVRVSRVFGLPVHHVFIFDSIAIPRKAAV
ncbi:helix-turn-helix transcriptional regulator [bacterium]|nr:helix-turn-helix transcriptional regulator [bacterium]